MYRMSIKLRSVNELLSFVRLNENSPCNVDVESGRYTIDGSSLMGLFAIDLFHRTGVVTLIGSIEDCEKLINEYRNADIKMHDAQFIKEK